MAGSSAKTAGALVFVGSAQFLVAMVVSEAIYPGYSVSTNFISDLGVGPAERIFNFSVVLLGVLIAAASYFIHRIFNREVVAITIALAGVGAIGVGLFPETAGAIHSLFSFVAFFFVGISAILAYSLQKSPLRYFSVIVGALSLVALALFVSQTFLGLGRGLMERMIVYPVLIWALGFGGYLMNLSGE